MKKIMPFLMALCAATLLFGISSCSSDDDNGITVTTQSSDTGSGTGSGLTPPSTAPEDPIPVDGYWMYKSGNPNLIIDINFDTQTAKMIKFSGLSALTTYITDPSALQTGDIISQVESTKSWALDMTSWVPAYKFDFADKELYFYETNFLIKDYVIGERPKGERPKGERPKTESSYSLSTVSAAQITKTTTTKWENSIPEPGTFSSEAVTINNTNKYLYAVVESSTPDLKVSVYEQETAGITDFTDLTPVVTINGLSFQYRGITFQNDTWNIILNNKTEFTLYKSPYGFPASKSPKLTTVTTN